MTLELDHVFICTTVDAPAADRLVELGLTEGDPNVHPGQGTACRRFFFHNIMLELLYLHNGQEMQDEAIRPVRLWERLNYRQTGYSPFGISLRSTEDEPVTLPFDTWAFRPPWLPEQWQIDVAKNDNFISEPMVFHISFGQRPERYPPDRRQPLNHPLGVREITGVRITLPGKGSFSPALQALEQANLVSFMPDEVHSMEIEFDGRQRGNTADIQPDLPLLVRW